MHFVIYGICFIITFVIPLLVFFRRIKIFKELKELKNLNTELIFDKDRNVVAIKNNIKKFNRELEMNIDNNHIYNILERICNDVHDGKKYNPSFYLSLYKKIQYRFIGNIFLVSHIAPIILFIFKYNFAYYSFNGLFLLQFVWYILIIATNYYISRQYFSFSEVFYCNWYNKLLNFDTLSINDLKEKYLNGNYYITTEQIERMLLEIKQTFNEPLEMLSSSIEKQSSTLQVFNEEIQKYNLVNIESLIVNIDENIKRFESLSKLLEDSTIYLKDSSNYLSKSIENRKIDINAINSLAGEFYKLRNTIIENKSNMETVIIEKLTSVTSVLENNINKTFTSIEETLKMNATELEKSYNEFFEICKLIVDSKEKGNA